MEQDMILGLEQKIQQSKTYTDNKNILSCINYLNGIFFEHAEELKIEAQLKQFNDEIRNLILGLKTEQANLNMLMGAPKMSRLLYKKAQEFLDFMQSIIDKLKTDTIQDGNQ